MVFKLWGFKHSTYSKMVAMTLLEKGVPFQYIFVDILNGEHKTEEFAQKHPFQRVPIIEDDDGFQLYESRAICRYVATKYANQGTKLIPDPSDLKAMALFDQAVMTEKCYFDPPTAVLVIEYMVKGFRNMPQDAEAIAAQKQALSECLDVYEKILARQKYIAADYFTVADILHIPTGLHGITDDLLEGRPNVTRWWKDITSRPSWQKIKAGITEGTAKI